MRFPDTDCLPHQCVLAVHLLVSTWWRGLAIAPGELLVLSFGGLVLVISVVARSGGGGSALDDPSQFQAVDMDITKQPSPPSSLLPSLSTQDPRESVTVKSLTTTVRTELE